MRIKITLIYTNLFHDYLNIYNIDIRVYSSIIFLSTLHLKNLFPVSMKF